VVVVQRDSINRSLFNTVVDVPLTKETKHVNIPGNVLLEKGDANLPRQSLARTTHIMVIDKSRLIEKIGTLPPIKTKEIINNILWVLGEEGTGQVKKGRLILLVLFFLPVLYPSKKIQVKIFYNLKEKTGGYGFSFHLTFFPWYCKVIYAN
jgi:mRNA interferase MazF